MDHGRISGAALSGRGSGKNKDFPAEFPAEMFFEEDRAGSAIDDHKFGEGLRAASSSGKAGEFFHRNKLTNNGNLYQFIFERVFGC